MKARSFIIMFASMCILVLAAGCSTSNTAVEISPQLDSVTQTVEEEASATDESYETETGESSASDTDIEAGDIEAEEEDMEATASDAVAETLPEDDEYTDFTALSAADCIEDVNGLPRITLECDGATAINAAITNNFTDALSDSSCTVFYECNKGADRVLSILMVQQYDGGSSFYTPYDLDLVTGEWIDGADILSIFGLSASDVIDAELEVMGQEFEYEFLGLLNDDTEGFYEEQYERTVSTDNADTNRLWFGSAGQLYFVAKIYPLAGAEYYEYPMSTGYSF